MPYLAGLNEQHKSLGISCSVCVCPRELMWAQACTGSYTGIEGCFINSFYFSKLNRRTELSIHLFYITSQWHFVCQLLRVLVSDSKTQWIVSGLRQSLPLEAP